VENVDRILHDFTAHKEIRPFARPGGYCNTDDESQEKEVLMGNLGGLTTL